MAEKRSGPATTPGHSQAADSATSTASVQRECPLVRAAVRLGDPRVLAAVARIHPALCCPAARREARR